MTSLTIFAFCSPLFTLGHSEALETAMAASAAVLDLSARLHLSLGVPVEGRSESVLPTGLPELDAWLGGWPRGRISELVGPGSAGKLSLMVRALAWALRPAEGGQAVAALVDLSRTVALTSEWAAGRLLVVRPATAELGLRALDMLLGSGAFTAIGVDIAGTLRRGVPEPARVRIARLARETGTAVLACGQEGAFGSQAALRLGVHPEVGGALRLSVMKNRQGPMGERVIRRPGAPEPRTRQAAAEGGSPGKAALLHGIAGLRGLAARRTS